MNSSPECERRRIGVEFLVETVPSLCKHVGELLESGTQSRVIPFQQLIYVLEDTGKYRVAMLTEMALKALENNSFEITVQFPSSLWLFSHVLLTTFHHPPSPCSCRALVHR